MLRDPDLTLADVQWVLGHAHITTTQIYTAPAPDEVISHVLAHHDRQRTREASLPAPPAPGYRPRYQEDGPDQSGAARSTMLCAGRSPPKGDAL